MKKQITVLMSALLVMTLAACSSSNTQKVPTPKLNGSFEGIIPCADCAGIVIKMQFKGKNYTKKMIYQGHTDGIYQAKGKWAAVEPGIIQLTEGTHGYKEYWKVDSVNKLSMLDLSRKPIETDLNYSVLKIATK